MARKTTKQDAAKAPKPQHVTKPPAAQEILSDSAFDELCDLIADGATLGLLEQQGWPSRSRIRRWIAADAARQEAYDAARQDRADFRAEELDRINQKLEAGEIDPASARQMSDNIKFQMSKEAPRRYGDTSRIDLTVSQGVAEDSPEELRASILKTISSLPLLEATKNED